MRYSIRDLLWLTLVAALAVGWWLEHKSAEKWRAEADGAERVAKESAWAVKFLEDNWRPSR